MATFLPNVTDVFAGSSSYTPDFNRIERQLKLRQNMYDQGARQVKTLYDSIFNSALMRDGNIERRDSYLKTITESMNRLTATDLSLPQNVNTATELFTPLTTDADLIKDISFTRGYQTESQKAEALRNSTDVETRKRYWSTGVRAMQYQAEEFKKASNEEARGMSNVRYTPNVDMLTLAEKAYKEAGISVKEDKLGGGYIWTKKNGDAVFPITQSFVNTLFSSDPAVADMLRTQAYVERKDFAKGNASKYGGEEQAEAFYIRNVLETAGKATAKQMQADDQHLKEMRARQEAWNKKITTDGIIPGSDEHKKYLADLEELQMAEGTVTNNNNTVAPPITIDYNNINELRQQADALVTYGNYTVMSNNIARLLAFKDAELTVKADPISLAQMRADLSLRNDKIMESIKNANKIAFEEMQIKAGKYKRRTREEEEEEETPEDNSVISIFNSNPFTGGSGPVTYQNQQEAPNLSNFGNTNTEDEEGEEPIIKSATTSGSKKTEKTEEKEERDYGFD
jgi:hypothetical protein